MFVEERVRVAAGPVVELHLTRSAALSDRVLLVIHGGPDWDHSYLREPLSGLTHRCLLLPDLRGCGCSSRRLPPEQYTWHLVVRDLLTMLDRLGLSRLDVLGFSTGGLIAQRLALAAPQRIRRLIIASSSIVPLPDDAFAGWAAREQRQRQADTARAQLPPTATGPDLTRGWAEASAPLNIWRAEQLPEYRRRLHRSASPASGPTGCTADTSPRPAPPQPSTDWPTQRSQSCYSTAGKT